MAQTEMESQQTHYIMALEKSLSCPICFDIFKNPATSSCGKHNYCLQCLKTQCEGNNRNCPECREPFHKAYKPQKNITLCEIVKIVDRKTSEDISEYEDLNPEDGDGIEHNLTLKRKLTDLTSEIKRMDDIISKKRKTKHQRKGVTSASNDFVSLGTFLSESKNSLRYEPSELPEEPLDNMTSSLRLGLECLTHALSQLPQLDIPSQDVDKGQNVGDSLSANQLPAEPSPVAWQQPDDEQTPEHTITPSQLEGGQSESQSEAQVVSMELETGAEEAGPSAALNDCLERLSFSPHLAHKNLVFSDQNRRVNVQRLCQGRRPLSRPDHFGISQVMADQEFSSGVHYWEVDTSQSVGWAIGVAYPNLGHGDKLGRTPSSWCLEWSSSKLCFWHNSNSEHVKHGCPSKVRIMLDMEGGVLSFYSATDNMILLHTVEVQFASPVRPAFWLYGLKPGNSLSLVVP
ncbi:E3 ubiquitin/ISG15 ligase TRIM25-like isoform X2 [Conger conger]|uniref:E3 ubiquitin/ISG15 ligase TRIM25-like isoform X2 n=1 Tax=Conger conger TaxID=82655 RepID=UPI002A5AD95E|nr:E3 ubiquitin/ISG15 ligase TRIM25-like isoform X2 [Conger conger]